MPLKCINVRYFDILILKKKKNVIAFVCKHSSPTHTLKTYGRHICSRRAHSSSSSPDPGPPGRQLEIIVKIFLTDGAGRHAGDIAAMQESTCNTTLAGLIEAIANKSVRVLCKEKKMGPYKKYLDI